MGGLQCEGLRAGLLFETQGNQIFGRDVPGLVPGYPGVPEELEEK